MALLGHDFAMLWDFRLVIPLSCTHDKLHPGSATPRRLPRSSTCCVPSLSLFWQSSNLAKLLYRTCAAARLGFALRISDATSSLLHDSIRTHRKLLHYKFEYLEDHLEQLLYVHAIWRVQLLSGRALDLVTGQEDYCKKRGHAPTAMGLSEATSISEVRTTPTRFSTRCRPRHIA